MVLDFPDLGLFINYGFQRPMENRGNFGMVLSVAPALFDENIGNVVKLNVQFAWILARK